MEWQWSAEWSEETRANADVSPSTGRSMINEGRFMHERVLSRYAESEASM